MRIVHVITRLIVGGAQENTLLSAVGQARDFGDEVVLVTGPGAGPEGSLLADAVSSGLELRVIEAMGRAIRPWRDWSSYRGIKEALADIEPEIVHTPSSKAGILGRAAAATLELPAVHTIHGAAFHRGQSRAAQAVYRRAERWAARRCQRLIGVCDAMTDQYVDAGIAPREKFTTVYSGMKVEPFLDPPRSRDDVRAELGFADEHVVVGKIARLFDLKGHEYLLAAAPEIARRHPEIRFLLVGDGPLADRFRRQIDRERLTDRFVFTGLVPPERIPELIASTDIVVHTSVWEGLARVLPQALIAGRPVISYDIDGAREVVIPGETGVLLPPESIEELVEAVSRLAGDRQLRHRLGQAGRERFTDVFRHDVMVRRLREIYEDVLRG